MKITDPLVVEYVKSRAALDTACRDKCLPWNGTSFTKKGAARIHSKHFSFSLAAFLYNYAVGPVPPGKYAFMTCLNKKCANPYHVIAASPQTAVRLKMGWKFVNGTWFCANGHRFTKENEYRNKTRTHCRKCYSVWVQRTKVRNASIPNRKPAISGAVFLPDLEEVG